MIDNCGRKIYIYIYTFILCKFLLIYIYIYISGVYINRVIISISNITSIITLALPKSDNNNIYIFIYIYIFNKVDLVRMTLLMKRPVEYNNINNILIIIIVIIIITMTICTNSMKCRTKLS